MCIFLPSFIERKIIMVQTETLAQFEQQLIQLNESEQQRVFSFIQSLYEKQRTEPHNDLSELEELIAVGSGTLLDTAEEK
jgi:glycerol dehydrogenase-like iron-containing ADH family enzyme